MSVATFATSGPVSAEIEIPAGTVQIIAGDREETSVTVSPGDPDKKEDVEASERTDIELVGERLRVRTRKTGGLGGMIGFAKSGSVEVMVELPERSGLTIAAGFADIRAVGLFGVVEVNNGAGGFDIEQATSVEATTGVGHLSLVSASGDAHLVGAGDMSIGHVGGDADVKNLNGRTSVELAEGALHVRSSNGDIEVGCARGDVAARTANGDISVGEVSRGSVSLATGSGSLEIGIAPGIAAWVDARTKFGRVRNSLETADQPPTSEGVVEVRARTSFGDIDVLRAGTKEEVR